MEGTKRRSLNRELRSRKKEEGGRNSNQEHTSRTGSPGIWGDGGETTDESRERQGMGVERGWAQKRPGVWVGGRVIFNEEYKKASKTCAQEGGLEVG